MKAGQIDAVAALVRETLEQSLIGLYLYGSAVQGGLMPASDLDVFAVTTRRTKAAQRKWVIDRLRPISARDARPAAWRPVELTILAQPDIDPWHYPPRVDFQSGEWLRASFDAGDERPWRTPNPDLAVLVAQVRSSGLALVGPPPSEVLPEVPSTDLVRAMRDQIASLLADLETDTANVLLTLARIWYTLATGDFAPKDVAADWALERLPANRSAALKRARDVYLGRVPGSWLEEDAWRPWLPRARSVADLLIGRTERVQPVATIGGR